MNRLRKPLIVQFFPYTRFSGLFQDQNTEGCKLQPQPDVIDKAVICPSFSRPQDMSVIRIVSPAWAVRRTDWMRFWMLQT